MEHKDKEEEFREVFEKHSDELFRHCHLRLSDRERAVELTQETFLRAWEYVSKGNVVKNYRPFLYRILNNLVVDEYRKKKSQSLDALLEDEETVVSIEGEFLRDESDALEAAMIRFDAAHAIEALKKLPQQYQVVLIMRYVDGFSSTEIAAYMKEKENAIAVRIHRGLRKLRDMLEL